MDKTDVTGLEKQELRDFVLSLGEKAFRANQLFGWIHAKRAPDFEHMGNLPIAFREQMMECAVVRTASVLRYQTSDDGTSKYLLAMKDGQAVECVLIPHDYGSSLCVSSQAGCGMACSFCASATGGLARSLTAGEIVSQALEIQARLDAEDRRIARVDFMGSGEPLDNYDNVVKAIRIMQDPDGLGIGIRRFSVSTCGIVPGIKRLTQEGLQVTLSLSLHAPNNELRSRLMPINRKYPLEEVIDACDEYAQVTGRRVTYEYALIRGVNDSLNSAKELVRLLKGRLHHVNLIPLNPVPGRSLVRSTPEAILRFLQELESAGLQVTKRREMGSGIDAACGQLRRREMNAALRQVGERPSPASKPR